MDSNKFSSSSEQVPVEPASPRAVSPSPLDSPTSAPESPPYNMASFKTSARNPQYYSIIRTRRSSEHHSSAPSVSSVEVGAKRPRGSTGASTTPPAKAMQLNTKERVPVGENVETDRDRDGADVASPQKRRSREKEGKKDALSGQQRPRTRSLSSSDNTSPPLKTSLSVPNEMGSVRGGAGLRSSPVTRSNAATMKTEFISLPARRRRGGGRRGRGRGGGIAAAGRGRGHDNMDEDREYVSMEMEDNESQSEEHIKEELEPPQQPPPPVKRRRGRPPKNRNKEILPAGSSKSAPTSTQTTPIIPPSNSAAGSSSTKQIKAVGRGGGRGGRAAMERDSAMEELEENPCDIKSSKLPPWVDETDEPTSKQQTSEASTPINESASLPASKSHSSKSESTSSASSTKESKSKTQESDQYEGALPHSQGKRGRKKMVDGSRVQNSEVAEITAEEKEIKTRSRAKNSRKASESTSEKETPPSTSPPVKEAEEGKETEKDKDGKDSTTVSRPSSVIVSVLSGSESKAVPAGGGSGSGTPDEQKHDQSQSMVSADEKATVSDTQQFKHSSVNESVPPMMGYPPPPTSAPTPTYPYSYTGGYPPPHPIMYPPGPASSMYPYYYHPGSAGSQPPPIMPHPYLSPVPPPPPVMIPTEQQGGSGAGLPSPHHSMNPFQFQTTSPSPNGPPPNTTAMVMSQSAATTVGGVRVTLLDKPPTQMPTVTVPHPNVSRSHPSPTNVYPGHNPMTDHAGNPTSPMGQVPLIRPSYIPTAGAHSPEGKYIKHRTNDSYIAQEKCRCIYW